jgi:hypothetical protein
MQSPCSTTPIEPRTYAITLTVEGQEEKQATVLVIFSQDTPEKNEQALQEIAASLRLFVDASPSIIGQEIKRYLKALQELKKQNLVNPWMKTPPLLTIFNTENRHKTGCVPNRVAGGGALF